MAEFHITEEMAAERFDDLSAAAESLSLASTCLIVDNYSPGNRSDFERYLNDHFIEFFSIDEAVTPHHPEKARKAGFTELVPPLHLWPWSLMVLRIGDLMRTEVGRGVRLRNVYRPMSYNKLVATSGIDSDHPNACSGDFDFKSVDDRRVAEDVVRQLSLDHPHLEISLGMGAKTLHVGIMSPKGKRSWFYKGYPDTRKKLD